MFFMKKPPIKSNGNGKSNGECKKQQIQTKLDKAFSELEEISNRTSILFEELPVAEGQTNGTERKNS